VQPSLRANRAAAISAAAAVRVLTPTAGGHGGSVSLARMVERFSVEQGEIDAGECVLTLGGEIDLATSPKLVVAGREALRAGATSLHVDLTGVSFMDSSGLAALINLHRSVGRRGGELTVTCPDGAVRRVFRISATEVLLGVRDAAPIA